MKAIFQRYLIVLIILLTPVLVNAAVDPIIHRVDASKPAQTITLDFTNGFVIEFFSNTANNATVIKVAKPDGSFQIIKTGITTADANSVKVSFVAKVDGTITVQGFDLELESPIQLLYGSKDYKIQNAAGQTEEEKAIAQNKITWTGIELHDAIQAKIYHDAGNDSLLLLLAALKKPAVTPTLGAVRAAYAGNNFILDLLSDANYIPSEALITKAQSSSAAKSVNALLSKAGDMDVTNLADGFARFLVKRTKEELNIAFFQHFKDLLNDPKYRDAQLLFPKTLETLNAIDKDVYQFENYITTLREAFEKDLSLLLDNAPRVINEGTFNQYFTDHPDLKYSLLLTLFSSRELVNGTHPGKVIETLPQEYINGLRDRNASGALATLQIISSSLRARGGSRYWTTTDTLAKLVDRNDPTWKTIKFYLGFLYEKSGSIDFQSHNLQHYLNQVAASAADIQTYAIFIKELGRKCNDLQSAISQIREARPETASIEVYHRAFSAFSDVVEQANKIGELPHINFDGRITPAVADYLKVFRQTNDLSLNVVQKNYGSAVMNVYNIYLVATGFKREPTQEIVSANSALYSVTPAGGVMAAPDRKHNKEAVDIAERTTGFIKRYGNLMANVAKAKTSEEVAEAVEALALPVGSASIKKHSSFSLTLNSYVGLYLGGEMIDGIDDGYSTNAYGVTAPIGFAINKGWFIDRKGAFSTSIFLSIVDLGAPVAFRFEDDKTEAIPSVKLKDIVSPGAFISIGLPKVPLSINWGYQMGPLLREIDASVATVADSKYSRISVSIVVDIPILNLYKSGK